jgi:plasmid stabilization system protein ParE
MSSAAVRWYEARRVGLGGEFFDAVVAVISLVETNPEIGTMISGDGLTRRALVARFPYQVVYRLRPAEIVIVAVAHLEAQTWILGTPNLIVESAPRPGSSLRGSDSRRSPVTAVIETAACCHVDWASTTRPAEAGHYRNISRFSTGFAGSWLIVVSGRPEGLHYIRRAMVYGRTYSCSRGNVKFPAASSTTLIWQV